MLDRVSALALLLSVASAQIALADDRPKVAVFDFKPSNVSEQDLGLFMEQVLIEIDSTHQYQSLGKSDLETMLGMEKLKEDLSGECDTSCMAHIAGAIGAQYVISGQLAQTKGRYVIHAKLIDERKARVIRRIEREAKGDFNDLRKEVPALVREVLGLQAKISGEQGELYLKASPESARYNIDGGKLRGRLAAGRPSTITLPVGKHRVVLAADGFKHSIEEVLIEPNRVATLTINLIPERKDKGKQEGLGFLDVATDSDETKGAEIYLNGQKRPEVTPATLKDVPAGEHLLALRKPLYKEWQSVVEVPRDDFKRVLASLEPNFGPISIESEPTGADVYIDGIKVGATPYEVPRLEAKAYKLKLTMTLYHDLEKTVIVEPESGLTLKKEMDPAFGTLKVESGEVEQASVWLDGMSRCYTPCELERLPSRSYYLKVRKDLYAPWEGRVLIRDGQTEIRNVGLVPQFGTLVISSDPEDAEIQLDGKVLGKTPFESKIEIGRHQLEVSAGDRYRPHEESFALDRNETRTVKAMLAPRLGKVMITSSVRGAKIILDGKEIGQTPQLVDGLFVGDHEVILSAEPNLGAKQTVTIREGELIQLEANLIEVLSLDEVNAFKDKRFKYQVAGWTLVGASAALAAGTVVFGYLGFDEERKADDLHKKFLADKTDARADKVRTARDAAEVNYSLAWAAGGTAMASLLTGLIILAVTPDEPEVPFLRPTGFGPIVLPGGAGVSVSWGVAP